MSHISNEGGGLSVVSNIELKANLRGLFLSGLLSSIDSIHVPLESFHGENGLLPEARQSIRAVRRWCSVYAYTRLSYEEIGYDWTEWTALYNGLVTENGARVDIFQPTIGMDTIEEGGKTFADGLRALDRELEGIGRTVAVVASKGAYALLGNVNMSFCVRGVEPALDRDANFLLGTRNEVWALLNRIADVKEAFEKTFSFLSKNEQTLRLQDDQDGGIEREPIRNDAGTGF